MDLKRAITHLLAAEGISQQELAQRAKVSQATVSRAAQRRPKRQSASYARLCSYMQQYSVDAAAAVEPVLEAIRETWDGSEEHANALAKLILASGELWPTLGKEKAP
jgi:transcriptional regulator with XRE-family HTH domain